MSEAGRGIPEILIHSPKVSLWGIAPLAVAQQTVTEGARWGVETRYLRTDDPSTRIVVANYEMLDHFEPANFAGIVLDDVGAGLYGALVLFILGWFNR